MPCDGPIVRPTPTKCLQVRYRNVEKERPWATFADIAVKRCTRAQSAASSRIMWGTENWCRVVEQYARSIT